MQYKIMNIWVNWRNWKNRIIRDAGVEEVLNKRKWGNKEKETEGAKAHF